jgi:hypothetical protein
MTTTFNGFLLLQAISQNEALFGGIEKDISTASVSLAKKFLKVKALDADNFRAFRSAVTDEVLLLLLDDLADKEVQALTKKIDKYYPNLADADARTLRVHLYQIASSQQNPSPKPAAGNRPSKSAGADKGKRPAKQKPVAKWAESMEAIPSRRRAGQ